MTSMKQRGVQLPPAIFVMADEMESKCGVKFNRQVLAAMLKFFFAERDENWIRVAVAVSRGDIDLENPNRVDTIRKIQRMANPRKESSV